MKRIVAVFMALALMVGAVTAVAEENIRRQDTAKQVVEYLKNVLKYMKLLYDTNPDEFDDGYILATYHYYKARQEMNYAAMAEMANESGGLFNASGQKMLEESKKLLDDVVTEEFYKWIAGEGSDLNFVDLLMGLVSVSLNAENE